MAELRDNMDLVAGVAPVWWTDYHVNLTLDNTSLLYQLNKYNKIVFRNFARDYELSASGEYDEGLFTGDSGNVYTHDDVQAINPRWKEKTMPRTIRLHRKMIELARSPEEVIDYVAAKLTDSAGSSISSLENALWGSETIDGGYSISGMSDIVSRTPTASTYATIDRGAAPQWRNIAYQANLAGQIGVDPTIFDGTPTTVDNIEARLSAMITKTDARGFGKRLYFLSSDWYGMLKEATRKKGTAVMQSGGSVFNSAGQIFFDGVEVINAGGFKFKPGGQYTGIGNSVAYLLYIDTFELMVINKTAKRMEEVIRNTPELSHLQERLGGIKLPLFSLPGFDGNGNWAHKEGFHSLNYYTQLTLDAELLCRNPAVNAVLFEQ